MADDNAASVTSSTDGYRSAVIDGVYIVSWTLVSSHATAKVISEVRKAHERHGDLVYVAVILTETPPPDSDGREALSNAVKVLMPLCSSMHAVIEGVGFRKAMHRAAAAFFLLAGQRGKMKVHESIQEALRSAGLDERTVNNVVARARLQKLIT